MVCALHCDPRHVVLNVFVFSSTMSSIERLQLSGIRSFSPIVEDKQTIHFHKPLTVILGKNGAGKTTIIEALLNATTGELPPGSSGNERSSFVFDPKAAGESDVKGQIRLVFNARDGRSMQVIRSFQVSQSGTRGGKTTFATLDSTLSVKDDATGKVESGTYRCGDVDRLVPEMLGVSKAVLEHVIFCHQEDCNWPLGPPGEVKKRFDEIFAASRYVAALDKLRDSAKDYRAQQKENESLLISLREHREQAKTLEKEVADKEENIRLVTLRNKEMEPRLQQLGRAVTALETSAQACDQLSSDINVMKGRVEEKEHALRTCLMASHASGLPAATGVDDVKRQIADLINEVKALHATVSSKEGQLKSLEAARRKAELELYEIQAATQALEVKEKEHAKGVHDMQATIKAALSIAGRDTNEFVVGEGAIDEAALRSIEESLQAKVTELTTNRTQKQHEQDAALQALNDARTSVLRIMDAEGAEREMKEQHLTRLDAKLAEVSAQLKAAIAASQGGKIVTQADIDAQSAIVTKLTDKVAADNAKSAAPKEDTEMSDLLRKIEAKSTEVQNLEKEHASQQADGQLQMKADHLAQLIADSKASATERRNTTLKLLTDAGFKHPETTAAATSRLLTAKKQQKAELEAKLKQLEQSLAMSQHAVAAKQVEATSMEGQLQRHTTAILQALATANWKGGSGPVEDEVTAVLATAEINHQEATAKLSSRESLTRCHAEFATDAQQTGQCPVCLRSFGSKEELSSFVDGQRREAQGTPATSAALRAATELVTLTGKQVQELRAAAHHATDAKRLREGIRALQAEIVAKTSALPAISSSIGDVGNSVRQAQEQIDGLQNALQVALKAEEWDQSAAKYGAELLAVQQALTAASRGKRPVDQIQRALADAQNEFKQMNVSLMELQRRTMERKNDSGVQQSRANLDAAQSLLRQLKASKEKVDGLQVQIAALQQEAKDHNDRVQSLRRHRQELQKELDKVTADTQKKRDQFTANEHGTTSNLQQYQRQQQEFSHVARQVRMYLAEKVPTKLASNRQLLRSAEATRNRYDAEAAALSQAVQGHKKEIETLQVKQLRLGDQLKVEELKREVEAGGVKLAELKAKLAAVRAEKLGPDVLALLGDGASAASNGDGLSFQRTREKLAQKMMEYEKTRSQNLGALEMLQRDLGDRRATLGQEKYRDVEKRYLSTFIRVQTTELAVQDIDKYYRALEKAVLSYHQEKIAQVNKIIGELWRMTYRGSDIDTIEIRSEDDGSAGGVGAVARRTSYKYRVVMRRGQTELDMRMRCSAGQKVLASVIIRLALSEAFCCDCGILALDEPTTNLDDDNARSLADALRELISARRTVKSFQLIVITHDEEFVRALGRGGGGIEAEGYYFISKDRQGVYSQIVERRFADLGARP